MIRSFCERTRSDRVQARIFRRVQVPKMSRRPRNMPWIGKAFQVNKMDFPGELLRQRRGQRPGQWSSCQCRRGRPVVTNRSFRSLSLTSLTISSRPIIMIGRTGSLPWGEKLALPIFRATSQRYDGADERIAPSFDICDVSIAELAVTKAPCGWRRRGPGGSLLYGYVRPDLVDEFRFAMTSPSGRQDRSKYPAPGCRGEQLRPSRRSTLSPIKSSKGPNVQLPVNDGAMHVCQPNVESPQPGMRTVGRKRRNCAWVRLAPTKLVVFPSPSEHTNYILVITPSASTRS